MSAPRIFSPSPLSVPADITVTGSAARHISKALRMQAGDAVTLFDGNGLEYSATITSIAKSAVELRTSNAQDPGTESALKIELWQGISKGSRMDAVIQKATEMGVTTIRPIFSQYGVVKLNSARASKRIEHWQEIAVSACEQSGRVKIPEILPVEKLEHALKGIGSDDSAIMLTPDADKSLKKWVKQTGKVILLIGPEGGFSEAEHQLAKEHHVKIVSMGKRVMRTETAPIAALSILQFISGDLS
ncbi:MAG: 16S rRNA (uracil(1498)-N(3))-methyltransferase [Gammaproteobacteria bacterium]|nr:16S rRNA (uracil(1498)-N(3))-methyltransferase [Gammaproteobacteria bacterium]